MYVAVRQIWWSHFTTEMHRVPNYILRKRAGLRQGNEWNDERSRWCYQTLNVMVSCNLEVLKGEEIPTSMILAERMQQGGGESDDDEGISLLISCGWESLVDRKSDTLGPRWRWRTIEAANCGERELLHATLHDALRKRAGGRRSCFGPVVVWILRT